MAEDSDPARILKLAVERLEASGLPEEIDVSQRFRIHSSSDVISRAGASLMRIRSRSIFTSCMTMLTSALPVHTPVVTSKPHKCHEQMISFPIKSPSPRGPPRCGQVLSLAKKPCAA